MKKQIKIQRNVSEEAVERKNAVQHTDEKGFKDTVVDSFWQDLLKTSAKKTLPEQLFGTKRSTTFSSGELVEGEEMIVGKRAIGTDKENKVEISREHIEYFRNVESKPGTELQEQRALEKRIEEILFELKKIMQNSKEIQLMFKEVTHEEMPIKPGAYHLNFLELILVMIRKARKAVESASWLSLFASKKQQKTYWKMFKKHGTTFGLSGERNVATQTG